MLKIKKIVLSFLFFCISSVFFAEKTVNAEKAEIVFMTDIHSHLDNCARAKTLIDRKKKENPDLLVVDGGDFSMGTIYQTVFSEFAPELRTLGLIGVEATTMGNHEFDYRAAGLEKMMITAKDNGKNLPAFVLCNADWEKDNLYTQKIRHGFEYYNGTVSGQNNSFNEIKGGEVKGSKPYVVINKGNLKIGVIGVFGKDALNCAPTCELFFTEQNEAVKKCVKDLKASENPDLIVCLSHCGTSEKLKKSEDYLLAKAVPELDLIISGHSHIVIEKPVVVGSTTIVSCGAFNKLLGDVTLVKTGDSWKFVSYDLISLDDEEIEEDAEVRSFLDEAFKKVDEDYLMDYGFKCNQVIADLPYDYDEYREVGFLIADSIQNTVKAIGAETDFSISPSGLIRCGFEKGPLTVSQVFDSYCLGTGKDGKSGYPVAQFWAHGRELYTAAEISVTLSEFVDYTRLFFNDVEVIYNKYRPLFNRVTKVYIVRDGQKTHVDPDKLYSVSVDLYSLQMLSSIEKLSKGMLKVTPLFEDGSKIENLEDAIVYKKDGMELKAWETIVLNLSESKELPDLKNAYESGYVEENSILPHQLLSNLNFLGKVYVFVVVLLVLFFATLLIFVIKKIIKISKKVSGGKK